ncbi:hypothetical protein [uncultured Kushneria sp.]|uniref:hypothetical protein n=1 Tax=uncultured Kushneria sp. TaxID=905033 RepID=UPI00262CB75C|nr:hypothetical protein [uncultured Kushneria sp.]
MPMNASGYIVASDSAIIGVGETIKEAARQALEWSDDYDGVEALIEDMEGDLEKAHEEDGKPYLRRATAALIDAVEKGGTPEQWTIIDNIACTAEEAIEHNS